MSEMFITIKATGAASGSVWHSRKDCVGRKASMGGTLTEIDEATRKILGFHQCRACQRLDALTEDEILVKLGDALAATGLIRSDELRDRLTAAANLRNQLDSRGLQFVDQPSETVDVAHPRRCPSCGEDCPAGRMTVVCMNTWHDVESARIMMSCPECGSDDPYLRKLGGACVSPWHNRVRVDVSRARELLAAGEPNQALDALAIANDDHPGEPT